TTFTVRFTPAVPGIRVAALHIASSDADENPFDIALTALAPLTGFVRNARLVTTFTNTTPGYPQYFGSSVAALGSDRVLIGATGYQIFGNNQVGGAAYLFSTAGTLLTTFTNPSSQASAEFGRAIAAVGNDRVIIGAPSESIVDRWTGVAYLFSTNGALLTTFTNPAPVFDDHFGLAVTGVGNDQVLIGAPWFGGNYGAAFLFSTDGTLLNTFTNGVGETRMGISVAALGSGRVLIGADTGEDDLGAAYVYDVNGTLLRTFTNPSGGHHEVFGHSVALVGSDRLLISAPWYGAAYLFDTDGTFLTTFANPTPAGFEEFGTAVAAVGSDRVLIGAMDSTAAPYSGAAYLFSTTGTLLTTITNPTPARDDSFGSSLAALGTDRVIIGAPSDDTGGTNAGAAYLFSLEPLTPRLSVTHSGGSVVFSWTKAADDFVLDQSESVTLGWSEVPTATFQTNDSSVFISLPAPTGNKFFRLHKP
ncbi:MAG TPA: hypothetical protein VFT34_06245, partial [Verrucomicrobiae bacterium]|nr:hypothetical protein [Verrucomicrobiae bacterium]